MKHRIAISMLLAVGVASLALAQTPESKQSASPTSNQYQIRIAEPMEGSTVTGNTVNIVLVDPPPVPPGTSVNPEERKDALKPIFQIWVDGKDYGNLPSDQNVFTASNLTPGPHTIVIAAKNAAGELIDRKELRFTTVERATATSSGAMSTQVTETTTMTEMPSAPAPMDAPAPPASAETTRIEAPSTADMETLPQTATAHPAAAVGGIALLALGLALRRRR